MSVASFIWGFGELTSPDVVLDKKLSAVTGVDSVVIVVKDVVEDVTVPKAEGRSPVRAHLASWAKGNGAVDSWITHLEFKVEKTLLA